MINEKGYKLVQSDMRRWNTVISKLAILYLIDHVLDFLLCWIVAHRSHQVR